MKFRGRMTELMAIKKFYNIIGTMAKLSKTCVMRFTADKVYFIMTEESLTLSVLGGRPTVWSEMETRHFFHEYNMEGVTPDDPEIYLEIEPERLAKTLTWLKSSSSTRSLKIKLTRKRNVPCLSFEIESISSVATNSVMVSNNPPAPNGTLQTPSASTRMCFHDVPVSLIPRKLWGDFKEPDVPSFDLSLYLPDLKQLKQLTDKYKHLSSHFIVTAKAVDSNEGEMNFSLKTDDVSVVTRFKHLELPNYDETMANAVYRMNSSNAVAAMNQTLHHNSSDDTEEHSLVTVKVELKRFGLFLAAEQIQPRRVVANFIHGKMIHLFIIHDDVMIQHFIPGTQE